ncbi:MAG: SRPBCC domain-containing protein [Calditrichia bacterium]
MAIPDILEIKTALQIQKPPRQVFEAIVNPGHMSHYFISQSSGRMETGKTLDWQFPEFEAKFSVRTGKIEPDEYISFYWENEGRELLVEMRLAERENDSTLVTVTEKSMKNDEAGIKWLKMNTEGWANFLACLKAYLEYGINLRKGGFDFVRKNSGSAPE